MKAIYVESDDDKVIELLIDAIATRLNCYERQNHSITYKYSEAIKSLKVVDDEGNITPLDKSTGPN